jgi:hypothetical protein
MVSDKDAHDCLYLILKYAVCMDDGSENTQ